jgi:hypothetical protein
MFEQFAGVTRIFGRDQNCFTQGPDCARGHVSEIPDRGSNQIECSHEMILSLLAGV